MENQLNTGTLETLTQGQTLLVNARKVKGEKIQLEFAEILEQGEGKETNILAIFNASDERFKRGARRAWLTAEVADAEALLGITLNAFVKIEREGDLPDQYVMELNILNPVLNGERLRVQITETTVPTSEWDIENIDRAAKRKGRDGEFITHEGKYIFTKSEVVLSEATHCFLKPDVVANAFPEIPANVDVKTGEIFS